MSFVQSLTLTSLVFQTLCLKNLSFTVATFSPEDWNEKKSYFIGMNYLDFGYLNDR